VENPFFRAFGLGSFKAKTFFLYFLGGRISTLVTEKEKK